MKKSIYILFIIGLLFLGVNSVNAADKKFTCKYQADFSDYSGKKINFSVSLDTDDNIILPSFDNVSGTSSTGGQYIILASKFSKKFLSKISNSGNSCPDLGLDVDGSGNAYIGVIDSSASEGEMILKGTFVGGSVAEDKKNVICSRDQTLRNDKDIKVEFYTIGTSKQWSISYTIGKSETSGNATDSLGLAGNVFYIDQDVISLIYDKKKCEPIYFSIPNQGAIHLTTTKPSDSENASYSVNNAKKDNGSGISKSTELSKKTNTKDPIGTKKSCLKCNNTYIPFGLSILSRNIINFIQLLVPVIIIITGMIELARAVIASDDKKMEESKPKLIKKIIAGIIIFLIFAIVKLGFNLLGKNTKGIFECAKYFISEEAKKTPCPERGQLDIDYGTSDNTEKSSNKSNNNSSNQNYNSCYSSCSSKHGVGNQQFAMCLTDCQNGSNTTNKSNSTTSNCKTQCKSKYTEGTSAYNSCYNKCRG